MAHDESLRAVMRRQAAARISNSVPSENIPMFPAPLRNMVRQPYTLFAVLRFLHGNRRAGKNTRFPATLLLISSARENTEAETSAARSRLPQHSPRPN